MKTPIRIQLIILLLTMALTYIFVSCSEENSVESTKAVVEQEESLEKMEPWKYEMEKWVPHHFVPKSGKIFGIWPSSSVQSSPSKMRELRTKYGYNKIVTGGDISDAIFAGYTRQDIMQSLSTEYSTSGEPGVWAVYIDEPAEEDCDQGGYSWLNYWATTDWYRNRSEFSNTLMITGDYFFNELKKYATSADIIMCTTYKNRNAGTIVPFTDCYWYYDAGQDQRPLWDHYKTTFGSKFKMTWIHACLDYYELSDLFGHAKNIGLQGVWVYAWCNPDETYLRNIGEQAYRHGWVRMFEEKIIVKYECHERYLDDCDQDPENGGEYNWEIAEIVYTGEIREATN